MTAQCPTCARSFDTERSCRNHTGKTHGPVNDDTCDEPDCDKPARSQIRNGVKIFRQYCSMHSKRRETASAKAKDNRCSLASCDRPVAQSRSLCPAHLSRLRTTGDMREDEPVRTLVRITSDTCQTEGCDRPRINHRSGTHTTSYRYCPAHRDRLVTYGDAFADVPVPAPPGAVKAAAALRAK